MEFQYTMSRRDYQRHLEEGYRRTSMLYVGIFSLFYIIISLSIIKDNFWLVFVSYVIYVLILMMVLYIVNRLFTYIILKLNDKITQNGYGDVQCKIDENGITENINDKKYFIHWNDIKKIKKTKKDIIIFSKKNNINLLFKKKSFKDANHYNELVNIIIENYAKKD